IKATFTLGPALTSEPSSCRRSGLASALATTPAVSCKTWPAGSRGRTRKPNKSGRRRPTAAVMAGLADHTWTFDELFAAVLA
ncbi:MAG TPA: hypothetical protein VND64_32590, partial [Pirellulales bacterium]|nr:hypothetical protein [Pirellulales bacterium]